MNKDMLTAIKLILAAVAGLLLFTPVILQNIFIFKDELSGPWIGFWGSFSGGLLGTLGVIFVAYLQNKEQRRLNRVQNKEQIRHLNSVENNERDRLRSSTLINMLQDYRNLLDEFNTRLNIINTDLSKIYIRKKSISTFKSPGHYVMEVNNDILNLISKVKSSDLNFEQPINEIISKNNIFKGTGLQMNNNYIFKDIKIIKTELFVILETVIAGKTFDLSDNEYYKRDIEFINKEIEDLFTDPFEERGAPSRLHIYFYPYEKMIDWLTKEIEIVDSNIVNLLNELHKIKYE